MASIAQSMARVVHRERERSGASRQGAGIGAYALVAGVGLLFLVPWLWLLSTSLKTAVQILEVPPRWIPNPVAWINYVYGVTSIDFFRYLANTLIVVGFVVIGRVFSCSVVAYALSHINWPGRRVLFALVLATLLLPTQVTIIPLFIIFSRLGWINTFLPLTVPAFFGDAFFIFLLRQFFLGIPRDLTDAARLDGASHLHIYWQIVMPLARPALATLIAFTFIWTFNDFQAPLIYLKDRELWTLALGMQGFTQRYGVDASSLGAMMAAAVLYSLPMVLIFLVAQKAFIRGIVTTGLK
jgi:multiple sugar transport system permease protein